jgi:hypothetical protein
VELLQQSLLVDGSGNFVLPWLLLPVFSRREQEMGFELEAVTVELAVAQEKESCFLFLVLSRYYRPYTE